MIENKKIYILGMARSGFEVAKLLSNYNNTIVISDAKEQKEEQVLELKKLGVEVIITNEQDKILDSSFDLVIKNPGIKYDNPSVLKARELNIPVINELEASYSFLNKNTKIIGVTGSNGKTTTVTLIYNFLIKDNKSAYLGGNIGIPLSNFVRDIKDDDILVLEISDHQLCDMYEFKTNISVLLNIYKAHIDFHDSFERYQMMKKRIFNNHTDSDIAIINNDNELCINLTNDINSQKYYFSTKENLSAYIKDNAIYFNEEKIIDIEDIKIKGIHNIENIMAAIIAVKQFNVSTDAIREVLMTFSGVEHRIEFVKEVNKVTYYNDSKATNCEATITALKSFDKPTILIMGGLDRGHSFDELLPYMNHVKEVICYGETKERIHEWTNKNNINCDVVNSLKEATLKSYDIANDGDVVLLSPACASWDQYPDFEVRGKEFKDIVNNL